MQNSSCLLIPDMCGVKNQNAQSNQVESGKNLGGSHVGSAHRCSGQRRMTTPECCVSRLPNPTTFADESMTLNELPDANSSKLPLSALHRRRVALQLEIAGQDRVLRGRGVFESDFVSGNVLRILLPPNAGCEVLIVEDRWNGEIQSGQSLGCDYLIRL